MIFVGLLSVVFLKKKLEWFRWAGMAVIFVGILMVGGADFMKTGEDGGLDSGAIVGDIIIVCAQVSGDANTALNIVLHIYYSLWLLASLSGRRNSLRSTTFILSKLLVVSVYLGSLLWFSFKFLFTSSS